MQALGITIQNNPLTIAFSPLGKGVFGSSTDLCAIIMLQTMSDFITQDNNSSLKIIRAVANNIQEIKAFTRIMMTNNLWDYLWRGISKETWFIKITVL